MRGYRQTYNPLSYQGELVCEGASFDDQVMIVHAVEYMREARNLFRLLRLVSSIEKIQRLIVMFESWELAHEHSVRTTGMANREADKYMTEWRWSEEGMIRGLLPETATRARIEPPLPPYLPLRTVYDNIELAYLDRTECEIPF